jgi:hypothetical protein
MEYVLKHARKIARQQIRLVQDAHNMTSLSLYASLGFDQKEALLLMQAPPGAEADPRVRPMTRSDLPAAAELCRRIYRVSREQEIALLLDREFKPLAIERDGKLRGYLIPSLIGHGVAESEDDAIALVGEMGRVAPPHMARFFCPLRSGEMLRRLLKMGCRGRRSMNIMTIGPYEPPTGTWMPSVAF